MSNVQISEELFTRLYAYFFFDRREPLQEQIIKNELQADRKWNHDSLKKLASARSERSKELKRINNAIRQKQTEFEAIKEDLKEVKDYLTEGQQNRLVEIDREWNDDERGW